MSIKLVGFWIFGAVLLFIGTWVIKNVQPGTIGVSDFSAYFAYAIAFILYLLAGLAWISVSVATKHDA